MTWTAPADASAPVRTEAAPVSAADDSVLMIFDGDCVLCSGAVRFLARHDPTGAIRYAAGRSDDGQAILAATGLSDAIDRTVIVLTAEGRVLTRSAAVLALAARLDRPWRWLCLLNAVPRDLLDATYDRLARNRYRLFGRRPASCVPPTVDDRT